MDRYILITGAAGFIGFHLCEKLLKKNKYVIGIDNINNYYDITLKEKRLENLSINYSNNKNWLFYKTDIGNKKKLLEIYQFLSSDKMGIL